MTRYINPIKDIGSSLLDIEKPARYTGGEYGIYAKEGILKTAVVFPDLYEIGMSNQALRIIYNRLNQMEDVSCDRAFAPAPDFEKLLLEKGIPLYGLDTGIVLADTDLLLVTLGYELGITGILSVLYSSGLALRSADRSSGTPIVIMGGPCVSNPLPYSLFVDAFWIGEAEAGFFDLVSFLLEMKKSGAVRSDLHAKIISHPHIWAPGKTNVRRAIYGGFGTAKQSAAVFPVSSIKTVQHHGAVEIMRGCPNGCRFCHAGIWYRPMRQKSSDFIMDEAEAFIKQGGYREISLSSLSTGDYCYINSLIAILNNRYRKQHISFQLPSLRVSGFSLPLLAKVSEVRKSGLTFAVETPSEAGQLAINKQVSLNEVISIINEAKKYGWRSIKFYFMVGLPLGMPHGMPAENEEKLIVDFVLEAGKATKTHFHLNLGTFVPKPHTPYQWATQLDEETAWKKFRYIQDCLKPRGHKISIHNPFLSCLEGIFSRGDENTGLLAEKAFLDGCRLDAWSDYFNASLWKQIINSNNEFIEPVLNEKNITQILPWNIVQSGVGEGYLKNELLFSNRCETTSPCTKNCTYSCGICSNNSIIVNNFIQDEVKTSDYYDASIESAAKNDLNKTTFRMLFSFSKTGTAVFIPHLGVIEVFSSALLRSGITGVYTSGFNPLLKIDFASPASVGLECLSEIASVDLESPEKEDHFINSINKSLPKGFCITRAELYFIPYGSKKYSPASLLWGFCYGNTDVPAKEEKSFRLNIIAGKNIFGLIRSGVLARNPNTGEPEDYFELYGKLYNQ